MSYIDYEECFGIDRNLLSERILMMIADLVVRAIRDAKCANEMATINAALSMEELTEKLEPIRLERPPILQQINKESKYQLGAELQFIKDVVHGYMMGYLPIPKWQSFIDSLNCSFVETTQDISWRNESAYLFGSKRITSPHAFISFCEILSLDEFPTDARTRSLIQFQGSVKNETCSSILLLNSDWLDGLIELIASSQRRSLQSKILEV